MTYVLVALGVLYGAVTLAYSGLLVFLAWIYGEPLGWGGALKLALAWPHHLWQLTRAG